MVIFYYRKSQERKYYHYIYPFHWLSLFMRNWIQSIFKRPSLQQNNNIIRVNSSKSGHSFANYSKNMSLVTLGASKTLAKLIKWAQVSSLTKAFITQTLEVQSNHNQLSLFYTVYVKKTRIYNKEKKEEEEKRMRIEIGHKMVMKVWFFFFFFFFFF